MKNINWIKPPVDTGEAAVAFVRRFTLKGEVRRATLSLSSMGNYAAYINGKRETVGGGVYHFAV